MSRLIILITKIIDVVEVILNSFLSCFTVIKNFYILVTYSAFFIFEKKIYALTSISSITEGTILYRSTYVMLALYKFKTSHHCTSNTFLLAVAAMFLPVKNCFFNFDSTGLFPKALRNHTKIYFDTLHKDHEITWKKRPQRDEDSLFLKTESWFSTALRRESFSKKTRKKNTCAILIRIVKYSCN